MEITRRNALKIIGATPVAAGLGDRHGASAEQAPAHTSIRRRSQAAGDAEGAPLSRSSSRRTSGPP